MADSGQRCRFCKEPMNDGAVYCTKCNNFQNWRRYVSFSSTMLALLIALITVLSSIFPQIYRYFETPSSQVTVAVLDLEENAFRLVAANNGNRKATIARSTLNFGGFYNPVTTFVEENWIDGGVTKTLVIGMNEIQRKDIVYALRHFFYTGEDPSAERVDHWPVDSNAIRVNVIHHDGEIQQHLAEIPKEIFEQFLKSIFPVRADPGPEIPVELW